MRVAENPRLLIVNVNVARTTLEGCMGIRRAFQALRANVEVTILHWTDVEESILSSEDWDALILGPNETPFPAYPQAFQGFLRVVRAYQRPILGICGGHQVLGLAHGAHVGPVFDIPEPVDSYVGCPKIKGVVSLETTTLDDQLMQGIAPQFDLDASHVEELSGLPDGFELLATSEPCRVQIMRHATRPFYGVQCHPERRWTETSGQLLLNNFLAIVDEESQSA